MAMRARPDSLESRTPPPRSIPVYGVPRIAEGYDDGALVVSASPRRPSPRTHPGQPTITADPPDPKRLTRG